MRRPIRRFGGRQIKTITVSRIGAGCLALFVFAGYYKAADSLRFVPVDLTLLLWAASGGFCLLALWRQRRLPPGSLPLLAVFLALAMGLHWPEDLAAYPAQKELRLFSLTALSAFAPLLLLQEEDARRTFVYTVAIVGVVMALGAAVEMARLGIPSRLGGFNTNPILLARAGGFAALVLCLLYWRGRIEWWLFLPAAAVALLGVVASGSRGPLAAFLVTLVAAVPLCLAAAQAKTRIWGTALLSFAGVLAGILYLSSERIYSGRRLLRLLKEDWGNAELARLTAWQETADLVSRFPAGVGWGRFTEWVQVYSGPNLMMHPHDIFLELAAEAGWLAAAVFSLLLGTTGVAVLRRAAAKAPAAGGGKAGDDLLVFLAGSYWLVCALFSGDVNDNRPLWAMLGMALAAQGAWRVTGEAYGDKRERISSS